MWDIGICCQSLIKGILDSIDSLLYLFVCNCVTYTTLQTSTTFGFVWITLSTPLLIHIAFINCFLRNCLVALLEYLCAQSSIAFFTPLPSNPCALPNAQLYLPPRAMPGGAHRVLPTKCVVWKHKNLRTFEKYQAAPAYNSTSWSAQSSRRCARRVCSHDEKHGCSWKPERAQSPCTGQLCVYLCVDVRVCV